MSTVKVKSPSRLAHVVLRTNNFKPMVEFYTTFFNATVRFQNDVLCFMSYDEEHHRIALVAIPGTGPKDPASSGLEHFAFTFDNLHDLMLAYKQCKEHRIAPFWCVNHGPTISLYYRDPDGNQIETQVENFETVDETTAFMFSKEYQENPIGTDFVPEELIGRLDRGEDMASITKRREIGPRGIPSF